MMSKEEHPVGSCNSNLILEEFCEGPFGMRDLRALPPTFTIHKIVGRYSGIFSTSGVLFIQPGSVLGPQQFPITGSA